MSSFRPLVPHYHSPVSGQSEEAADKQHNQKMAPYPCCHLQVWKKKDRITRLFLTISCLSGLSYLVKVKSNTQSPWEIKLKRTPQEKLGHSKYYLQYSPKQRE
jgi:hypothetical protein